MDELILALNDIPKSVADITLDQNLSFYKNLPEELLKHSRNSKVDPINSLEELDWDESERRATVFLVADQPCHVFFRGEGKNFQTYTNVWHMGKTIIMKGVYRLVP